VPPAAALVFHAELVDLDPQRVLDMGAQLTAMTPRRRVARLFEAQQRHVAAGAELGDLLHHRPCVEPGELAMYSW